MRDMPDPVPELEPAAAELMLAVGQLSRRIRSESAPHALSLSQASVLARLERKTGLSTADLARAEAMKPQSMGKILVDLERAGLVERHPHPSDRRQFLYRLTRRGTQMRQRGSALSRSWMIDAIARLDVCDRKRLIESLPVIRLVAES
ncbi:MAG: MarR family transcriptional regulator [Rhodobacteraceae bacterium]|nr:MarR family transcriptional regulator [Paracoccaceae bacterium]